jgi:hypothetical protein
MFDQAWPASSQYGSIDNDTSLYPNRLVVARRSIVGGFIACDRFLRLSPSHGGNTGSNLVGDASRINRLHNKEEMSVPEDEKSQLALSEGRSALGLSPPRGIGRENRGIHQPPVCAAARGQSPFTAVEPAGLVLLRDRANETIAPLTERPADTQFRFQGPLRVSAARRSGRQRDLAAQGALEALHSETTHDGL